MLSCSIPRPSTFLVLTHKIRENFPPRKFYSYILCSDVDDHYDDVIYYLQNLSTEDIIVLGGALGLSNTRLTKMDNLPGMQNNLHTLLDNEYTYVMYIATSHYWQCNGLATCTSNNMYSTHIIYSTTMYCV